ncbi:MAG: DUF2269 domain-containing protein [Sphingomonadales bacterium]|nr:DUF2269 domain-containing protein [Sphingomonadales bacterium]
MIDTLILARWMHVIGATVLLGTGSGIAFFMLMAHRTKDAALIAHVAQTVVVADVLFTASAVIVQPLTGLWLAHQIGWPLATPWILWSVGLYIFIGCFWLPVVRMQMRMRDLARAAAESAVPLPPAYFRLYRLWFACGIPAFAAMLAIIWLMLERPSL